MNKFLPLVLFLAACGVGTKITPGVIDETQGGGVCPESYDPIPLQRPGSQSPQIGIDALPPGRYDYMDTEYYVADEGGFHFQAHYFENLGGNGLLQRRICSSLINDKDNFSASVPALASYNNPAVGGTKGYTVRTYTVAAVKGRATTTNETNAGVQPGSFQAILQGYQQYRVYQLTQDKYEIRARFRGESNGRTVTKQMVQAIVRRPN